MLVPGVGRGTYVLRQYEQASRGVPGSVPASATQRSSRIAAWTLKMRLLTTAFRSVGRRQRVGWSVAAAVAFGGPVAVHQLFSPACSAAAEESDRRGKRASGAAALRITPRERFALGGR